MATHVHPDSLSATIALPAPVDEVRFTVDPTTAVNLIPHTTSDEKKGQIRDEFVIFNMDSRGGGVTDQSDTDRVEGLKDQFLYMRDVVLNLEIKNNQIQPTHLEEISDFRIIFTSNVATYTDPNNKKEITVDLLDLPKEAQIEMDKFFKEMDKVLQFSRYQTTRYSKHNKGNIAGDKPLQKTTADLKKRAKDHKQAQKELLPKLLLEAKTPEARKTITDRVMFAELAHQSLINHFEENMKRKQVQCNQLKSLQNADPKNFKDQRILAGLSNELDMLKNHHQELKNLNVDLLTRVLAKYPVGSYTKEDLDKVVDDFVASEKKELEITRKLNSYVKFGWNEDDETREDAKKELEYIDDETGMFYLTRGEYTKDRIARALSIKQESLEDIVLRESISFVNALEGRGNYDGKGFAQSALFDDFSEDQKMQAVTHMGIQANKWKTQFPNVDAKHFEIEIEHNPHEAKEMKNAIDQKRKSTLEGKIEEYRKKIFPDPAPPPNL